MTDLTREQIEAVCEALLSEAMLAEQMDDESYAGTAETMRQALTAIRQLQRGWMGIDTLTAEHGAEVIVGCWVETAEGCRWSQWIADSTNLGCDGEFGDDPTHFLVVNVPLPPAGDV